MSIGPCLCGDVYCNSCGNPAAAAFDDALEAFIDLLINLEVTLDE